MDQSPAKPQAGARAGARLKHIATTVDDLLAAAHQEYASALQHPELGPRIRHDVKTRSVGSEDSRSIADAVRYSVAATRVKIQQWQRSRIVYRVDPELVAALLDTDQAATIPGEIFLRLPHPDPMVLLDPPLELPGTDQHLLGFLTGAETDRGELVSTADARAGGLAVSLCRQGHPGRRPASAAGSRSTPP